MVQIGQEVQGHTILAIVANGYDEVFILGKSDNQYVTARMSTDVDTSWYWGEYYSNITYRSALHNFHVRVKEHVLDF